MNTLLKVLILAALAVACRSLTSCQTKSDRGGTRSTKFYREVYLPVIEKNTRSDRKYNGFHNRFQYHATLLGRQVTTAQIEMKDLDYNWSDDLSEKGKKEALTAATKKTTFFISFFSPEKEAEDLSTENSVRDSAESPPGNSVRDSAEDSAGGSVWRIYLEVAGSRYPGRVEKNKEVLPVLQRYFPYHNRWSRPFKVYFSLPSSLVERSESVLVITGPIGESRVKFSPSSADFVD